MTIKRNTTTATTTTPGRHNNKNNNNNVVVVERTYFPTTDELIQTILQIKAEQEPLVVRNLTIMILLLVTAATPTNGTKEIDMFQKDKFLLQCVTHYFIDCCGWVVREILWFPR